MSAAYTITIGEGPHRIRIITSADSRNEARRTATQIRRDMRLTGKVRSVRLASERDL